MEIITGDLAGCLGGQPTHLHTKVWCWVEYRSRKSILPIFKRHYNLILGLRLIFVNNKHIRLEHHLSEALPMSGLWSLGSTVSECALRFLDILLFACLGLFLLTCQATTTKKITLDWKCGWSMKFTDDVKATIYAPHLKCNCVSPRPVEGSHNLCQLFEGPNSLFRCLTPGKQKI